MNSNLKQEIAREVYQVNCDNGFHNKTHNDGYWICQIVCELAEAVDADRKGLRAKWDIWAKQYEYSFNDNYEEAFKSSLDEELADAVMRCMDFLVLNEKDWEALNIFKETEDAKLVFKNGLSTSDEFVEIINWCISNLYVSLDYSRSSVVPVYQLMLYIEQIAEVLGIRLLEIISLKLTYNKERGYLHGKKY